ncbi:hypothetical protein [Streptomyces mirabilis]|uniref:hypothetical protein n=1 Tax=Streptomyces mirabilis TaxID=68239 RepID=UPI00324D7E7D
MPEAIPVQLRRDDVAAHTASLVRLGRVDEQSVPAPSISPFLEPDLPPPPVDGE